MIRYEAHTYCDFGTPGRKSAIGKHFTLETGLRQYKRLCKVYHDINGWRCWLECDGRTEADTHPNSSKGGVQ